jgi:mono/diheme cytochrome c family protein
MGHDNDSPVAGSATSGSPAWAIHGRRKWFLIALPFLLIVYVFAVGGHVKSAAEYHKPEPPVSSYEANHEPNGAALFLQHCSRCHGERGKADGATSEHLNPWARRFGEDRFQLATTTNAVPTDEDLTWVIDHGIAGTAMPSFEYLADAEKQALVRHLRLLTWAGLYRKLYAQAEKDDDVDIPRIIKKVDQQLTPGPRVEAPAEFPVATPDSLSRGRKFFLANCATCHGNEGHGDGPGVKGMKTERGQATFPRDLARGVFKGGGERERLYYRLALGMPGTPMPGVAAALKPDEIGDVVNFVKSLSANAKVERVPP